MEEAIQETYLVAAAWAAVLNAPVWLITPKRLVSSCFDFSQYSQVHVKSDSQLLPEVFLIVHILQVAEDLCKGLETEL